MTVHQNFGERVVQFIRALHPTKPAECVEHATGIPAHRVGKWLEGASAPKGADYALLVAAYGPEILCAVLVSPPAWLSAAAREEEQRRLRAEIATLQAKLEGPRP